MNKNNLEDTINALTDLSSTYLKLNNASINAQALMKSLGSEIQSINSKDDVKRLIALYKADCTISEYSVKIDEVISELNNSICSSKEMLKSFDQALTLLEFQIHEKNQSNDPIYVGVLAVNTLKMHNIHHQIEMATQTLEHLKNWKLIGISGISSASNMTFACEPSLKSTCLAECFKTINSNYLKKSRIALYFSFGFLGIFLLGSLIFFIADNLLFSQFQLKIYFFTFFILILTTLFLKNISINLIYRARSANKTRNKDYSYVFILGLIVFLVLNLLNFSNPLTEEITLSLYSVFCILSWITITTTLSAKYYFEYKRHKSYFEITDAL